MAKINYFCHNTKFFSVDAIDKWEACMRINIGKKLKLLRFNRFNQALTLQQVCDSLDVEMQRGELSRIEKGMGGAGEQKLFALLLFYNISFDWLIDGDPTDIYNNIPLPVFKVMNDGIAEMISAKISFILNTKQYIPVDENCKFIYVDIWKKSNTLSVRKKNRRLISLIKFCAYYNISLSWLVNKDALITDRESIPKFEEPRVLLCQSC